MSTKTGQNSPIYTESEILAVLQPLARPKVAFTDVALRQDAGGTHVAFVLTVDPADAATHETLRKAAEQKIGQMPGILSVTGVLTAHRVRPEKTPAEEKTMPAAPRATRSLKIPGVAHMIAVASGKGGVGKSTTAANLALALSARGLSVGLLDADIYGPSVPKIMGIKEKPTLTSGKTLEPLRQHGVKLMSMGFLVDEETPMIWRGPMVQTAIQQMLRDVAWAPLDVLVIDMPPGTGDAQLTLAQQVPLSGAIIVSTPQDLALLDARKGLAMFRRVNVPILGIIENMSLYVCPQCGHESHLFGHGGAAREAEKTGVPFLGEIPLDLRLRETSDAGTPIVVTDPEGLLAARYHAIAEQLMQQLETQAPRTAPRIVIEA